MSVAHTQENTHMPDDVDHSATEIRFPINGVLVCFLADDLLLIWLLIIISNDIGQNFYVTILLSVALADDWVKPELVGPDDQSGCFVAGLPKAMNRSRLVFFFS